MKTITALIFLVLIFLPAGAAPLSRANQALLDSLDAALARAPQYATAKERRLEAARQRLATAASPEEQYWLNREIFLSYSFYDSDSALVYSSRVLNLAHSMARQDWINDVLINRAYILSATGLFESAHRALGEVEVSTLPAALYLTYCETSIFLQTHYDQFLETENDSLPFSYTTDELLERLCSELPASDPNYYWVMGWVALRSPEASEALIPDFEASMDGYAFNERSQARMAWMLSSLYNKADDQENRLKYMILSATADVRASVREMASLEELTAILFDLGDLDRANSYISYATECALQYKSRSRLKRLTELQATISGEYEARNADQKKQLGTQMKIMTGFVVLLLIALGAIVLQFRRLRKSKRQLDEANVHLSTHVSELQDAREQLAAANESLSKLYASVKEDAQELSRVNEAKEKYIADIFAICSDYISKLDEFRKKINRMIMAGHFDEVRQLTKSPELSHAEIKELYANFDRIFLQIYPDFVADFNKLLRPEERIELKKNELMNTELRIYALVRLGLNDSVKISRFLHCSVQTVYNTRLRIRNKAIVPREDFANIVQSLGKAAF